MLSSKCVGCDQYNAVIYDDDDMYCNDCYKQKTIEIECYCDGDKGLVCHHHEGESNV